MLHQHGVDFRYREYTEEPLDVDEIRQVLTALGLRAREVLRTRDAAYRALEWSGSEDEDSLIARMAEHPTLLQRPIGYHQGRAVVGRPPSRLLTLIED